METIVLNVTGMSCEHCVRAVTNAVGELQGVSGVAVSLENNTATVTHDAGKVSPDDIKAAIEFEGYEVV